MKKSAFLKQSFVEEDFERFLVANLFRISCPLTRNSELDRQGLLFLHQEQDTTIWCRLHWHPFHTIQFQIHAVSGTFWVKKHISSVSMRYW
jgi:hypothetical protein